MNSISDTTVSTADIEKLLDAIDTTPKGMVQVLDASDAWYQEPREVWIQKESELVPSAPAEIRAALADGDIYTGRFAEFYDFTGRRILHAERSAEGWWEENVALNAYPDVATFTSHENAVGRFGSDYLIVGRGHFLAVTETVLDGEPAFEFLSRGRYLEQRRAKREQRKAEFFAANPAVEEAKPWWATAIDVDFDATEDDPYILIDYTYSVDELSDFYVSTEAHYKDGKLTFTEDTALQKGRQRIEHGFGDIAGNLRAMAYILEQLDKGAAG